MPFLLEMTMADEARIGEHNAGGREMAAQDLASRAATSRQFVPCLLGQLTDLVCVADADYHYSFLNVPPAESPFHTSAGAHCYETLTGGRHPCTFCPLREPVPERQAPVSRVVRHGDIAYQMQIASLRGEDGLPLCLHVLHPINANPPQPRRGSHPVGDPTPRDQPEELIGESPLWRQVKDWVQTLAAYPTVTILLEGETGTGKELVARALHTATYGAEAPFVPLCCAALPEHLLESELFGYERGAFTGASHAKPGLLELAHGGTLFLDEIEDLSPSVQAKLLRVLETKRVTRLGSTRPVEVAWRLCCATNAPLQTLVAAGTFRADLFHRLSGFTVTLPPLRERPGDIPLLVDAFLTQANLRLGTRVQGIAPDALAMLQAYAWPGNVRELHHCIERAVILTDPERWIEPPALSPQLITPLHPNDAPSVMSLREIEHQHIAQTLAQCQGNQSQAAACLGISRTTLRKKLRNSTHG